MLHTTTLKLEKLLPLMVRMLQVLLELKMMEMILMVSVLKFYRLKFLWTQLKQEVVHLMS